MTTTLIDPEAIPLTNAEFRKWMDAAGRKLEELDQNIMMSLRIIFLT